MYGTVKKFLWKCYQHDPNYKNYIYRLEHNTYDVKVIDVTSVTQRWLRRQREYKTRRKSNSYIHTHTHTRSLFETGRQNSPVPLRTTRCIRFGSHGNASATHHPGNRLRTSSNSLWHSTSTWRQFENALITSTVNRLYRPCTIRRFHRDGWRDILVLSLRSRKINSYSRRCSRWL